MNWLASDKTNWDRHSPSDYLHKHLRLFSLVLSSTEKVADILLWDVFVFSFCYDFFLNHFLLFLCTFCLPVVPRSVSVPFKASAGEVDHRSAVWVFNISVSLVWLINEHDHTCKTFYSRSRSIMFPVFSKASRRTRLCASTRSSPWVNCCDCRRRPPRRSGYRGWRWSGCCSLPPFPRLRSPRCRMWACGWVTFRLQNPRRRSEPSRTGRSRIQCHSTGDTARSWSGSSGSGCLDMEAASRCGSGWRWAC